MTLTTKCYVFTTYSNYVLRPPGYEAKETKDGKVTAEMDKTWAEGKRDKTFEYLKRLLKVKAQFACIAREDAPGKLMLRGYVHLNSPCSEVYFKRLLGKFSACKPSYFGDAISLCRLLHCDRDLFVTGRLPRLGGNSMGSPKVFSEDPHFVVKMLLESIDSGKKDLNED